MSDPVTFLFWASSAPVAAKAQLALHKAKFLTGVTQPLFLQSTEALSAARSLPLSIEFEEKESLLPSGYDFWPPAI